MKTIVQLVKQAEGPSWYNYLPIPGLWSPRQIGASRHKRATTPPKRNVLLTRANNLSAALNMRNRGY